MVLVSNNALMEEFAKKMSVKLKKEICIDPALEMPSVTIFDKEKEVLEGISAQIDDAADWVCKKEKTLTQKPAEKIPAMFDDDEARVRFGNGDESFDVIFIHEEAHFTRIFLSSLFLQIQRLTSEHDADIARITEALKKQAEQDMELEEIYNGIYNVFKDVFAHSVGLGVAILQELLPTDTYAVSLGSERDVRIEELQIYRAQAKSPLELFETLPQKENEKDVVRFLFSGEFILSLYFEESLKNGINTRIKAMIRRRDRKKQVFSR